MDKKEVGMDDTWMIRIGAITGGWHGAPHLDWGFVYHLYSSFKAIRGEERRGENPDVPVSCGNTFETYELQKD